MKEILIVPDQSLRKKSLPIDKVTNTEIEISKKMMKIMKEAPGIGLAAPQLGIHKRIITINIEDLENKKKTSYTLFNPEIVNYSKNKIIMEEGCLSVPKQFAEIERPENINIKYIDTKNRLVEKRIYGLESRVIQHEIDHLEGILFIDFLSPLKRNIIIRKVKKLKKIGEI